MCRSKYFIHSLVKSGLSLDRVQTMGLNPKSCRAKVCYALINHFSDEELEMDEELKGYLEKLLGDRQTVEALPVISKVRKSLDRDFGVANVSFSDFEDVDYRLNPDLRDEYSSDDLQRNLTDVLSREHDIVSHGRGGPYSFCYSHRLLPEIWVGPGNL